MGNWSGSAENNIMEQIEMNTDPVSKPTPVAVAPPSLPALRAVAGGSPRRDSAAGRTWVREHR